MAMNIISLVLEWLKRGAKAPPQTRNRRRTRSGRTNNPAYARIVLYLPPALIDELRDISRQTGVSVDELAEKALSGNGSYKG
jgi:hypothetical protein